ncbi:hypothetical protein SASPL_101212 [Salvia splendens]|uniref:Uncharacterized protein n=1 Tax=Salvia splendens TaxID=180675 RepID=A0A8X9ABQ0_SALSN|nr:hypothetical protein SASPL_101212 [Salvia splendens]
MSSPATKKKATPGLCSLGSRCEPDYQVSVGLREQEGYETSDSSSLDEKIAYSCMEARVFDYVYDRGMGEEELGDFEDSVLETAAKKTTDRDADSWDTGSVSNVAIRLPSENHGSREELGRKLESVGATGEIVEGYLVDVGGVAGLVDDAEDGTLPAMTDESGAVSDGALSVSPNFRRIGDFSDGDDGLI